MTLCHLCALIAKVLTWRGVCRGGSGEFSLQSWARVPCSHMEVAPMIQTTYCRRDIDVLGAIKLKSSGYPNVILLLMTADQSYFGKNDLATYHLQCGGLAVDIDARRSARSETETSGGGNA